MISKMQVRGFAIKSVGEQGGAGGVAHLPKTKGIVSAVHCQQAPVSRLSPVLWPSEKHLTTSVRRLSVRTAMQFESRNDELLF